MTYLALVLVQVFILIFVLLITRQFEKRNPVESEQSSAEVIVDWKLAAVKLSVNKLLSPIATGYGIIIINSAGGGLINLRSDGWWFLLSLVIIILASDLLTYVVHRAQHKLPVLWAMHSLHHSAEAMSMVTGIRHFWFEEIYAAPIFWIFGIIFK